MIRPRRVPGGLRLTNSSVAAVPAARSLRVAAATFRVLMAPADAVHASTGQDIALHRPGERSMLTFQGSLCPIDV